MATIGKEEAARILGISERTLERNADKYRRDYGLSIQYEQGRTKRVPVYDREQIERLAARLKTPVVAPPVERQPPPVERLPAIPTQSDTNGDTSLFMSALAEMMGRLISLQERSALPPAPDGHSAATVPVADKLALSVAEAAQLTGFTKDALREAINAGRLKAKVIKGRRGWTIKREDLDVYVRKL